MASISLPCAVAAREGRLKSPRSTPAKCTSEYPLVRRIAGARRARAQSDSRAHREAAPSCAGRLSPGAWPPSKAASFSYEAVAGAQVRREARSLEARRRRRRSGGTEPSHRNGRGCARSGAGVACGRSTGGAGHGGEHLGFVTTPRGQPARRRPGRAFPRFGLGRLHRGRGGTRGLRSDGERRPPAARVRRQQRTGLGSGPGMWRTSAGLRGALGLSCRTETIGRTPRLPHRGRATRQ